jgi:hypothetical protein
VHSKAGFLSIEKPFEKTNFGARFRGRITDRLVVEVLLKVLINLFFLVHFISSYLDRRDDPVSLPFYDRKQGHVKRSFPKAVLKQVRIKCRNRVTPRTQVHRSCMTGV